MKVLASLVLIIATSAAAQNLCPCPQSDDMSYETDTRTLSPVNVPLCTEDGCGVIAVQVAHRIITPATTDGSPPALSPHYLGVEANGNFGFPEPPSVTLTVAGGAAMFTVTPTQPNFLLVPASKSLVSPQPPPAPAPSFLCSKLRSKPTFRDTLMELDQFGANNPLMLDRLDFICQTADTATPTTVTWLACFSINKRASTLVDPQVTAFVNTQLFGSFVFNRGALHTPDEFCFAATRV